MSADRSDTLRIDPKQTLPFKPVHSFGYNTCHAPIVMRGDVQKHMRLAHQELGMRYWRCHGTLSDDVGILSKGCPLDGQCTFSGLKRILNAGLATGAKPFLELSFLPSKLARDPSKTVCFYKAITSPPADWLAWEALIEATMKFLLETYGRKELSYWYFEVWNEPNIPFWTGTREEYFLLYQHAVRAIKRVCPELRVGGPATARAEWVPEFLAFCLETETPVDFVSTHIYPSDVEFLDAAEGSVNLLGADFLHHHFKRVRAEVDAIDPKLPIFWGEWNSSAGPLAENHDTCNNAALICSALAGMEEYGDGSLYWNLSDIYEECQYHFAPFHGGYGLYTVDDVPKSAARAFEFWNALESVRVPITGLPWTASRGAFATVNAAGTQMAILAWNHTEGTEADGPWEFSLEIEGVHQLIGEVAHILPGQGSAYETWLEQGKPANLTPAQLQQLQQASQPSRVPFKQPGDRFRANLPSGTVSLFQLALG